MIRWRDQCWPLSLGRVSARVSPSRSVFFMASDAETTEEASLGYRSRINRYNLVTKGKTIRKVVTQSYRPKYLSKVYGCGVTGSRPSFLVTENPIAAFALDARCLNQWDGAACYVSVILAYLVEVPQVI